MFFFLISQDSVFRLEPHVENGRGKSPYDPKLLTASLLIGEFKSGCAVAVARRSDSLISPDIQGCWVTI